MKKIKFVFYKYFFLFYFLLHVFIFSNISTPVIAQNDNVSNDSISVFLNPSTIDTDTEKLSVTVKLPESSKVKFDTTRNYTIQIVQQDEEPGELNLFVFPIKETLKPTNEYTFIANDIKLELVSTGGCGPGGCPKLPLSSGQYFIWVWDSTNDAKPNYNDFNAGGNVYVAGYQFNIFKTDEEKQDTALPEIQLVQPRKQIKKEGDTSYSVRFNLLNGVKDQHYMVVWDWSLLNFNKTADVYSFQAAVGGTSTYILPDFPFYTVPGDHTLCIRRLSKFSYDLNIYQGFFLGCEGTADIVFTLTEQPTPTPISGPSEGCKRKLTYQFRNNLDKLCRTDVYCKEEFSACNDPQYDTDVSQGQQQTMIELEKICDSVPDNPATDINENEECGQCLDGRKLDGIFGSYTAIGCLPTDIPTFFKKYLWTYGLGIAGGIGFLLMLWGAFNILISMGDAKKIEHGRELIISALVGILFIIFSILILRVVGVDILKIPGFE